ncbi:MAG TPA: glycosyltransferase family A protein [Xanthomonadales bacterium]|nr:glycosyltransferase family A protein [Xanthomonadales bacterium]
MTTMATNSECLLSILIATMDSRQSLYTHLREELARQCAAPDAGTAVEVVALSDDGSEMIGVKRNRLMDMAKGNFLVFVDDDDRISPDYTRLILAAIRENPAADCIIFPGEITFRGRHPHKLVHSIQYTDWHESGGTYVRPPCHITPIRSDIARRYRFAAVDWAEDMDWALRISQDKALQQEVPIDSVLYYYNSRRRYAWQWLLDKTQAVRHALGLRSVSRLSLQRRLRTLARHPKS